MFRIIEETIAQMCDMKKETRKIAMAKNDPISQFSPFFFILLIIQKQCWLSASQTSQIYDLWEKTMRNALRAKNKLGFVYGMLAKQATGTQEAYLWESGNSMLVSWIFNSIKSMQSSITYIDTAKEVWD